MAASSKPELYVVDGSNIATEGRNVPSLEQLNEAVLAFLEAHPHATVTVVVDATFGHRIAKKEVAAFDEAVANNELVTPPAGAVGRGDAFVLAIADRANAGILSNDSFQEFHGDYEWLFDDGRLIGGKPVPHVGWVFVKRTPVRGPKSRQSVREASQDAKKSATATKEQANRRVRKKADTASDTASDAASDAATPSAAPTGEPNGVPADDAAPKEASRRGRRGRGRKRSGDGIDAEQQATIEAAKAVIAPKEHVNDLMPFLEFVEHHPVGTSCTAVVESYSSHGAYARVDDVLVYLPLRLMGDPAPRSARSVLSLGEAVTTVIVGYVPDRRSIDVALPNMAGDIALKPIAGDDVEAPVKSAAKKPTARTAPAKKAAAKQSPAEKTVAKKTVAKQTAAKKSTAEKTVAKKTVAKKTVAKKTAAKSTAAKKNAATQIAAETTTAKTAARRSSAEKSSGSTAPAEAPAKKTPARKTPARKTPARKTPARKTPAEKAPAQQAPAKKSPAEKTPAQQAPAKKSPAKKMPAKRAGAATTRSRNG